MQLATTIALAVLRISGLIQLALGLLFWTGNALFLISIHMRIGFVVIFALWALVLLAARAGVSAGSVALAFLWGLIVPIVGLTQARLLPGDLHWVIQVLHLLLGVGAISLGESLAVRIRQKAGGIVDSPSAPS